VPVSHKNKRNSEKLDFSRAMVIQYLLMPKLQNCTKAFRETNQRRKK
jgi:hypothetical protein